MSISGYHIREAGATAVQELAFTFANALAYVQAAQETGLDVDTFAPRLSFFLASHNHFLEEVAKFRAARRIWAKLMRDRFGATDPKSWKFRFHTQTSGMTLVAQEPDNNVVRVALQALASILGGTQSLHTNSRDEALALPSEESAHIALRTQQIIAYESGAADTVDPLGGAYCIESLTDQIEEQVMSYLQKIQDMGGALKAIDKGFIQKEIQDSAYEYQKQIETKERLIVGANILNQDQGKAPFELYYPPEKIEKDQIAQLFDLKTSRDKHAVDERLNALRTVLQSGKNVMPAIISAVRTKVTLGEISDVMRDVFGTYTENIRI
jgi:methylmalonyl-CoA mutase N-terminal domain/subunit